jgi:hypothetical protein
MKRDTYLTVDLDYWYSKKVTGTGFDFIQKLFALNRPMKVFTEHHLILKDIDKQYKKVINVDYHSDLADRAYKWPNCGTWANYVQCRHNATFEWRYPNDKQCIKEGMGLCHPDTEDEKFKGYDLRNGNEFDPFHHPELWTWKNVVRKKGIDDLELDTIDKISFVLSPIWSRSNVIHDTLVFLTTPESNKAKYNSKTVRTVINQMLIGWYP